jgi:hypothetical protein
MDCGLILGKAGVSLAKSTGADRYLSLLTRTWVVVGCLIYIARPGKDSARGRAGGGGAACRSRSSRGGASPEKANPALPGSIQHGFGLGMPSAERVIHLWHRAGLGKAHGLRMLWRCWLWALGTRRRAGVRLCWCWICAQTCPWLSARQAQDETRLGRGGSVLQRAHHSGATPARRRNDGERRSGLEKGPRATKTIAKGREGRGVAYRGSNSSSVSVQG